jgi:hypothetical protein
MNNAPLQIERNNKLPERITREEKERHEALVKSLGAAALWKST